ncbi:hypothetical protein PALB_13010 [Pseudoalteromonas luteoviolacea B = ATCC 29581]|nr:hypothetical protein PALB_13010 [Pseudoalteromonas luteoviolacea B = ATCC 29581]
MDADLLLFLFNVFLFFGVIIALKDHHQIKHLRKKILHLQARLDLEASQVKKLRRKLEQVSLSSQETSIHDNALLQEEVSDGSSIENVSKNSSTESNLAVQSPWQEPLSLESNSIVKPTLVSKVSPKLQLSPFSLDEFLKGNGIFWLGSLVLALGGLFLAKYSIEAGLLSPLVRVAFGALFGISLVIGAEVVNQYKEKLNIHTPNISAALAGGGVITCFAMSLVAFDFYRFITPDIAFVLLALISLAATSLALRYGPVLAGIGIIGSYIVPAVVSTGSNNVLGLLLYVSFISLSAVWVAQYVKQTWLWWLSFAGHFVWFLGAALIGSESDFVSISLFAAFSLYLYVLSGLLGWQLKYVMVEPLPIKTLLMPRKEQAVIFLTLFLSILYLTLQNEYLPIIWFCLLLGLLAMFAANRHSALDSWPFWMLGFVLYVIHLMPEASDLENNLFPFTGKYLFVQVVVLVGMVFSLFMLKHFNHRSAYFLLLAIVPISLYGVSFALSSEKAEPSLYPIWAMEMLMIAAFASYGAVKTKFNLHKVTYLVLANAMLTLCFTMLLSASTLTLALVAQVASMSYLSWKYEVRIPDWIYKVALLAVVSRLSLAPWLEAYKDEVIFTVHWTLVVYPVTLALIWFAAKYQYSKKIAAWLKGVFVHLIALLITTETSYLLVGDYPDFFNLSYHESIVLALNWLILTGVYLWRSKQSDGMTQLYQTAGMLLLLGITAIHFDITVLNNPFIELQFIGAGLVNWTLLQWFVPALTLSVYIKFKLLDSNLKNIGLGVIGVFGILFINGVIRNAFHDGYLYWFMPLQQAELYTYSIVWLAISTIALVVAHYFNVPKLTNAGFIGLAIVVLKAFGIDMAHLEGLLRAMSFIGLGLCLVGIGWLSQKIQKASQ